MDIRKPALLLAFAVAVPAFAQKDGNAPTTTPDAQSAPSAVGANAPGNSTSAEPKKTPDRAAGVLPLLPRAHVRGAGLDLPEQRVRE